METARAAQGLSQVLLAPSCFGPVPQFQLSGAVAAALCRCRSGSPSRVSPCPCWPRLPGASPRSLTPSTLINPERSGDPACGNVRDEPGMWRWDRGTLPGFQGVWEWNQSPCPHRGAQRHGPGVTGSVLSDERAITCSAAGGVAPV